MESRFKSRDAFVFKPSSHFVLLTFCTLTCISLTTGLGVPKQQIGSQYVNSNNGLINKTRISSANQSVGNYAAVTPNLVVRPTPSVGINIRSTTQGNRTDTKAVWCYCNLPQCVPNGYLCQSVEGGACFSKSAMQESLTASRGSLRQFATDAKTRGCVELLSRAERLFCDRKLGYSSPPSGVKTWNKASLQQENSDGEDSPGDSKTKIIWDPILGSDLMCCNQNVCNYKLTKPIIIREIEGGDPTASRKVSWLKGTTIGVSVAGVIILIFLLVFAGRMLTSEAKGQSPEFLQNSSRDFYIKVPYHIERTPPVSAVSGGGCSVLCVKSLQKNLQKRQDVADYCRFHPLSSTSNRHSLSCPSSLSNCSTLAPGSLREEVKNEELQPLTSREEIFSSNQKEGNVFLANQREGNKVLANRKQGEILIRPNECLDQVENLLLNS